MGRYLANWPDGKVVALWDDLAKRFSQMGGTLGGLFSPHGRQGQLYPDALCGGRAEQWGAFTGEPKGKADRAKVEAVLLARAHEAKHPLCQISMILARATDLAGSPSPVRAAKRAGPLVTDVVLALHYQNEVVHPQGRIRLGIAEDDPGRHAVIAAAKRLLAGARAHNVPVISVRIAFAPDYIDVKTNAEIWRRVVANKVMAEGSWGAEFYEGLAPLPGETVVTHCRNDAFYGSALAIHRRRPRAGSAGHRRCRH